MARGSGTLLKCAAVGINKTLAEILVCPLSKQPLRLCAETNSLVSDSIGVSFPIVDGIPRLVPSDGKIIDGDEQSNSDHFKNNLKNPKEAFGDRLEVIKV